MYLKFDKEVEKALKGNKESKEWIINKLKPLIVSYSKKYGGQVGWNDELYQEGAWQILEALEVFDINRGIPFLGFVTVRLKHYYQNKRRKEKQFISLDQLIGEEEEVSLLDIIVDETISIEEDYLKEEESQNLRRAIKKLSEKEREIIEDYYFNGKVLKDIAKERNIHYITASKNKAKALKKLSTLL